jgi:hypothetical protein
MLDLKQFISYYVRELQYPPQCFAILPSVSAKHWWVLPTNALREKKLKFLCLWYIPYIYILISYLLLRAGTSIYASSGFGPLGPKPCGGNKFTTRADVQERRQKNLLIRICRRNANVKKTKLQSPLISWYPHNTADDSKNDHLLPLQREHFIVGLG